MTIAFDTVTLHSHVKLVKSLHIYYFYDGFVYITRTITVEKKWVEPGRGGRDSHTLTIRVCATGQGMVFSPLSSELGI